MQTEAFETSKHTVCYSMVRHHDSGTPTSLGWVRVAFSRADWADVFASEMRAARQAGVSIMTPDEARDWNRHQYGDVNVFRLKDGTLQIAAR